MLKKIKKKLKITSHFLNETSRKTFKKYQKNIKKY